MKNASFSVLAAAFIVLSSVAAVRAQSSFSQAINGLNPAGYWPMHETNLPPANDVGDIETNYGTLGLLGNGYYPDWAANSGAFSRQVPGALAGDSDTAMHFNRLISSGSGAAAIYTNQLYIPHASPLSTLNPPFSVEIWYYPTNTSSQTFWGQFGFEGFNAGAEGHGDGNYSGMILVYNGSFTVYGEDKGVQTSLIGSASVPISNWYHMVVTCDASTNVSFYTNGVQVGVAVSAVGKFTPDYWSPMTIGGSRGGTRSAPGTIDEFAMYTNVLSTNDIAYHYSIGTNASPQTNYFTVITNDNPVIYLRMDAANYAAPAPANWEIAGNSGITNGVPVGAGVYTPGTVPGILPGPAPAFGGVTNNSPLFSGVSSFVDAGNASIYNPTGAVPFSISAIVRGYPCDNRVQSIVSHGTNSWELTLTTNGFLVFNSGTNSTAVVATSQGAGDLVSSTVVNDGNWHLVVATHIGTTNMIYVDGLLNNSKTNATTNFLGSSGDVLIGSDPNYTNNPAGVGRQFAGQICDVAFFTNALTATQVQALYSACEVAPAIAAEPVSASVDAGVAYTNVVVVTGSAPLVYQWYTNGVAFGGQTNASLIFNPVVLGDAGTNYYLIVTNNYGSATSAVVSLTVYAAPAFLSVLPVPYTNLFTLYAGANPSFSVTANGAQPINYYWFTNGVNVAGQNSTNYQITNVQIGPVTVACLASNFVGWVSNVWSAQVIADPVGPGFTGLAPYPQSVLALNPIGYWRLNDTNLDGADNTSGDDGYIANDYAGGNNGIYTNVYIGEASYDPATDPSDSSAEFGEESTSDYGDSLAYGIAGINFASPANTGAAFTVEAWVNGYVQSYDAGIVTVGYGGSEQFDLDTGADGGTPNHAFRFFFRDAGGTSHIVNSSIAIEGFGAWYHLAGVVDDVNNDDVSLYINGTLAGTASLSPGIGVLPATTLMSIGSRMSGPSTNFNYQFQGEINDVAVYNYALSAGQIAAQYVQTGVPPSFTQPPVQSVTVNGGGTLTIPVTILGTPSLTNWWSDVSAGTNIVTGMTNGMFLNAGLTVSNVPGHWNNDQLELTVSNAFGETNVFVALTVLTNAPQITAELQPRVLVVSGDSYTYSIGVAGAGPFGYQWYNATTPVTGQTNSSYSATAGSVGSSTTYYVVITNVFGAVTSSVSTLTSIAQLTTPYATNLLQFNPVGYWPMHEVEAPAQGDIETNYGTLGLLGTAFYPDWATNNGYGITRSVPGALAGDSDQACGFTDTIIVGAGGSAEWTNALYVPHTSPLSTLNPPFTVECWCYPVKTTGGQDVWAQFGFAGLNAGLAGLGGGNYDGIQLVYNGSFTVYGEDNGVQTGLVSSPSETVSNWYHLVVTCDAETNMTIYTDGALSAAIAAAGEYTPDYWTPLTLANGRGPTRAMACGLDEFAVYTNVLSTNDIAYHYAVGTNASPQTNYFTVITSDKPVIYLRMDAPAVYTPPPASAWPVLTNYGNAGGNGYYTPGTMPGIVAGPTTANGVPLVGLSGPAVAQLSGVSSFADAGDAAAFNPTGPVPFSLSAVFRGNPCDNRVQAIVGHSANSWRMVINTNGTIQCSLGTNSSAVVNSARIYNDDNWHQAVDVYTPASNPNLTGTNALYVDGLLDTSVSTVSTNGIGPGSPLDVMIGADPQYTNSPAGVGEQFAGQVCEVALFNNALSAGQVQQLYNATVPVTVNTNPTNIVFSVTGNQLTLSWPADHLGWTLEAQTNRLSVGISTNWVPVSGSASVTNLVIPINLTNGSVFYRLMYQ